MCFLSSFLYWVLVIVGYSVFVYFFTGIAVHSFSHASFVTCGKYCPGHPNLCVTGGKDKIQTWDLRAPNTAVATFGFKDHIGQVEFLPFS